MTVVTLRIRRRRDRPPSRRHWVLRARTSTVEGSVVFTRDQLLKRVWGFSRGGPRTVDVHIRRLRAKLPDRRWC